MIYIAVIETHTPQLLGILKKKHRRKVEMGGFETVQVTVMRGYLTYAHPSCSRGFREPGGV